MEAYHITAYIVVLAIWNLFVFQRLGRDIAFRATTRLGALPYADHAICDSVQKKHDTHSDQPDRP